MEAMMACSVIEVDLMEIFRARPAEWLDGPAFRPVIARHAVGFGLGVKLYSMACHGPLEDKGDLHWPRHRRRAPGIAELPRD
jgi:hypothetical protein